MKQFTVPVLFGLIGASILIYLGVWQTQRLQWKEAKLQTIESMISANPIDLPDLPNVEMHQYLPVSLKGEFVKDEVHILTSRPPIGPGYRVISTFITNNIVVIKRSIEDVFEYVNKEKKEKSELWIIGGSQIYELFINYVSEIHWTRALKSYDCNIYLTIDLIKEMIIRQWKEKHSELDSLESDGYQYCVWKKQ